MMKKKYVFEVVKVGPRHVQTGDRMEVTLGAPLVTEDLQELVTMFMKQVEVSFADCPDGQADLFEDDNVEDNRG